MVTTTERPERLRRAIASGTAGLGPEEVIWVNPRGRPSLPGTSSDSWTLSHEPQKETPVLDPVGPNPSPATFVYQMLSPFVQYFNFGETAATYMLVISPESPLKVAYALTPDVIASRISDDRAREVIARAGLEHLVREMAELMDSNLEPTTLRGGSVVYQESFEDPEDWEVVVVTKLAISRQERFELSLRIGEALSQHISRVSHDPLWARVTFRLDLA